MNPNKNHSKVAWDCYHRPCPDQPSASPEAVSSSVADAGKSCVGEIKTVTQHSPQPAVCHDDDQHTEPQPVCHQLFIFSVITSAVHESMNEYAYLYIAS